MQRTPYQQEQAEKMREHRRQFAQRLRAERRDAQGGESKAQSRLMLMRQSMNATMYPNPDRRRDCARHADRALERYNDLRATDNCGGAVRRPDGRASTDSEVLMPSPTPKQQAAYALAERERRARLAYIAWMEARRQLAEAEALKEFGRRSDGARVTESDQAHATARMAELSPLLSSLEREYREAEAKALEQSTFYTQEFVQGLETIHSPQTHLTECFHPCVCTLIQHDGQKIEFGVREFYFHADHPVLSASPGGLSYYIRKGGKLLADGGYAALLIASRDGLTGRVESADANFAFALDSGAYLTLKAEMERVEQTAHGQAVFAAEQGRLASHAGE